MTFASVTYDLDTSATCKATQPRYYGLIPRGPNEILASAALVLFGLCFLAAKLIAVSALGNAKLTWLLLYFLLECVGLLFVRVATQTYRFWGRAGDSIAFSLAAHVTAYSLMLAAPFLELR